MLEQLPHEVLRTSIWQHLLVEEARPWLGDDDVSRTIGRAFRLGCRRSRHLADQLIRRIQLCCSEDSLQAHGALISCQEGLEELALMQQDGTDDEGLGDNLIIRALLLGGATCQRLHTLELACESPLTAAAGQAVKLCCPSIRHLHLSFGELDPEVQDMAFFQPLRTCQDLSEVTITFMIPNAESTLMFDCGPAVLALSQLAGLLSLSLAGRATAAELAPLTALSHLRKLHLNLAVATVAPEDAARVGRMLARLTHPTDLQLPRWQAAGEEAPADTFDAALAVLGGLRNLSSLAMPGSHPILDDGFRALRELTALTRLSAPPMSDQLISRAGRLPRRQHLTICDARGTTALAVSLRPFLPLPELRYAALGLSVGGVAGDVVSDADLNGQAAADALQFAQALAAAPRLVGVNLRITGRISDEESDEEDDGEDYERSAAQAAAAVALLQPLQGMVTQLRLRALPVGSLRVMWPVLCGASRLEMLRIVLCHVPEKGLLALVGQYLPLLRALRVQFCDGVTGATAVLLAARRVQPLRVDWIPLTPEHTVEFRAAARPGVTLLH